MEALLQLGGRQRQQTPAVRTLRLHHTITQVTRRAGREREEGGGRRKKDSHLLLFVESIHLRSEPAHVVREEHHRADLIALVVRQQRRHLAEHSRSGQGRGG